MSDMKARFYARYLGPKGRHLSCLTATSITGSYKDDDQRSIHPRVIGGRTRNKKVNTSEARNPDRKGYLAKASKELDRRRRDCESTISFVKNKSGVVYTEGSYSEPGSMRIR
jgi:hypothetical protein